MHPSSVRARLSYPSYPSYPNLSHPIPSCPAFALYIHLLRALRPRLGARASRSDGHTRLPQRPPLRPRPSRLHPRTADFKAESLQRESE